MADFPSSPHKCAKAGLVTHFKIMEEKLGANTLGDSLVLRFRVWDGMIWNKISPGMTRKR